MRRACLLLLLVAPLAGAEFQVIEKRWNGKTEQFDFFRVRMDGTERTLRAAARGAILSEDQSDYPEPESGCGPTALLNLYIWYSKFGLVEESVRHAEPERYKRLKFAEIDRRMREVQKQSRTEAGGTNVLETIVVLDALVRSDAPKPTRIHYRILEPPLHTRDFLALNRNFRAGLLSVRPKDLETGELLANHVVLVTRTDRTGKITVANWGEHVHGRLIQRGDHQWFVPDNPDQNELRINRLTQLIPFTPRK